MTVELTNDHIGFAIAARRIGDLLAGPAGVDPEDAPTAAQWRIPLCEGRGAPETAEGLQDAKGQSQLFPLPLYTLDVSTNLRYAVLLHTRFYYHHSVLKMSSHRS